MSQLQPWYWRSLPLEQRTGSEIFQRLFLPRFVPAQPAWHTIATLLESPYPAPMAQAHSRYSICAGPPRVIQDQPRLWVPPVGSILQCLKERLAHPRPDPVDLSPPDHLPFTGGGTGWLGYDRAWEIEAQPPRTADPLPFPTAFWYEPQNFAVLYHAQQVLWLAVSDPQQFDPWVEQLQAPEPASLAELDSEAPSAIAPPRLLTTPTAHINRVREAQQHIQAGDIFQANLSLRFHAQATLSPWLLYRQLQRINPSPFASYWQTPWGAVVSGSPERLVQLREGQAQTRPIAGTRARGQTPAEDQRLAAALKSHPKELAEHIMLVDLERNDLGRVCEWGSVQVDEFLTLEYYSHVIHLVSNVMGQLGASQSAVDLIRAVFPGGTITGCPKVRCLEIIDALEPLRRNLFYGSCGYLDCRGHLDLNILIRTLLVTSQAEALGALPHPVDVWGQVGAGIVADSEPQREWHESWQKAQAQLAALQQLTQGPS